MKRAAIIGFVIWAAVTAALRVGGQYLFRVSPIVLLIATLPVMIGVALLVLRVYPTREERALAAIALAAPGMLLDAFSAIWFSRIFPNIPADAAGTFGGLLLFCNVVVLLTAIKPVR